MRDLTVSFHLSKTQATITITGRNNRLFRTGFLLSIPLWLMANIKSNISKEWRWHPTPVLLPGEPHGRRSLVGCSKSQTRLSDFTFTFHFLALEKEMATHSSVLAWRIPGTGEPGGLPSMGSQSRTRLKRLSSKEWELDSNFSTLVFCQHG